MRSWYVVEDVGGTTWDASLDLVPIGIERRSDRTARSRCAADA
jgi:hypothetical protein